MRVFHVIALVNIIVLVMLIILYWLIFGSTKISIQQNDWTYFFDFIIQPMTFLVAVSALILSYLNFSVNKDKYDKDLKEVALDRKIKMLENLYSRYMKLKEKYELSYQDYSRELCDFQK